MTDKKYTYDEIVDMFQDSNLNAEFKDTILTRFNAMTQAMYNAATDAERTMKMLNTYGDSWAEEHNAVVTEYQKY